MNKLKDCKYCMNLMALMKAHDEEHHEGLGTDIETIDGLCIAVRINALDILKQKAQKEMEDSTDHE